MMKRINVFAVFSTAAILTASMMCGCSDNNEGYTDVPRNESTTAAEDIAERTTKVQDDTGTAASTTTKSSETTTKEKSSSKKTTTTNEDNETTTTTVFGLDDGTYVEYHFRSEKLLNQHFEKHGSEFEADFDYNTPEEYEKGASDVINNENALHKTEAEDGDGVYYIEETNEFVILSTDGYIRTYFRPNGGKSYYDRQ